MATPAARAAGAATPGSGMHRKMSFAAAAADQVDRELTAALCSAREVYTEREIAARLGRRRSIVDLGANAARARAGADGSGGGDGDGDGSAEYSTPGGPGHGHHMRRRPSALSAGASSPADCDDLPESLRRKVAMIEAKAAAEAAAAAAAEERRRHHERKRAKAQQLQALEAVPPPLPAQAEPAPAPAPAAAAPAGGTPQASEAREAEADSLAGLPGAAALAVAPAVPAPMPAGSPRRSPRPHPSPRLSSRPPGAGARPGLPALALPPQVEGGAAAACASGGLSSAASSPTISEDDVAPRDVVATWARAAAARPGALPRPGGHMHTAAHPVPWEVLEAANKLAADLEKHLRAARPHRDGQTAGAARRGSARGAAPTAQQHAQPASASRRPSLTAAGADVVAAAAASHAAAASAGRQLFSLARSARRVSAESEAAAQLGGSDASGRAGTAAHRSERRGSNASAASSVHAPALAHQQHAPEAHHPHPHPHVPGAAELTAADEARLHALTGLLLALLPVAGLSLRHLAACLAGARELLLAAAGHEAAPALTAALEHAGPSVPAVAAACLGAQGVALSRAEAQQHQYQHRPHTPAHPHAGAQPHPHLHHAAASSGGSEEAPAAVPRAPMPPAEQRVLVRVALDLATGILRAPGVAALIHDAHAAAAPASGSAGRAGSPVPASAIVATGAAAAAAAECEALYAAGLRALAVVGRHRAQAKLRDALSSSLSALAAALGGGTELRTQRQHLLHGLHTALGHEEECEARSCSGSGRTAVLASSTQAPGSSTRALASSTRSIAGSAESAATSLYSTASTLSRLGLASLGGVAALPPPASGLAPPLADHLVSPACKAAAPKREAGAAAPPPKLVLAAGAADRY